MRRSRSTSPPTPKRWSRRSAGTGAAATEDHGGRRGHPVRGPRPGQRGGPRGGGGLLRSPGPAGRLPRPPGRRLRAGGDRGTHRRRAAAPGPGLRPLRPGRRGVSVDAARLKKIEEGAAQMGVRLAPDQLRQLGRHVDLMLKWNKSINLTAITDPDEVVEKHVLDSLAVVPLLPSGSLLDAGTGAGFPGIPLALARPELDGAL